MRYLLLVNTKFILAETFIKMPQENCNITWHTYSDHLKEMMTDLRTFGSFTDVTLISDDNKQSKAHRTILSACSPVLKNILQMNSNDSHCMIYLKGIQHLEVESILQFIYHGEAKLQTERTEEFLSFAEDLEIKELSKILYEKQYDVKQKLSEHEQSNKHEIPETPSFLLGSQIDPNLKENRYSCDQCDKKYSSQGALLKHTKAKHEGILKYECSYCEYKTSRAYDLSKHVKRMHEFENINEQHECSDCDYKTRWACDLSKHVKTVHEYDDESKGILQHKCSDCEYITSRAYNLSSHVKRVHECESINKPTVTCDKCKQQFSTEYRLNTHICRIYPTKQ